MVWTREYQPIAFLIVRVRIALKSGVIGDCGWWAEVNFIVKWDSTFKQVTKHYSYTWTGIERAGSWHECLSITRGFFVLGGAYTQTVSRAVLSSLSTRARTQAPWRPWTPAIIIWRTYQNINKHVDMRMAWKRKGNIIYIFKGCLHYCVSLAVLGRIANSFIRVPFISLLVIRVSFLKIKTCFSDVISAWIV